jgi:nucleotide-binding universal stress UspA family protein
MTENDEVTPRRVVVGVDGSKNSARAAVWAAREAVSRRVPLTVGAGYVVEGLLAHSPTPVAVVPTHAH